MSTQLSLPRVFVAVWDVAGETGMSYVPDYAGAPGDLDGVLADLLHGAVAADVKEVWLEVLAVAAWVSSNQEEGTPGIFSWVFLIINFSLNLNMKC